RPSASVMVVSELEAVHKNSRYGDQQTQKSARHQWPATDAANATANPWCFHNTRPESPPGSAGDSSTRPRSLGRRAAKASLFFGSVILRRPKCLKLRRSRFAMPRHDSLKDGGVIEQPPLFVILP